MQSLTLLGMPGSGKSTLGSYIATKLALDFVDTDDLIEDKTQKKLQSIVSESGYLAFRAIEEKVLLDFCVHLSGSNNAYVIATGGSAVYGKSAMAALSRYSRCVYLYAPLDVIVKRVSNFTDRGIAAPQGSTLASIFTERDRLYREAADHVISVGDESPSVSAEKVIQSFSNLNDASVDLNR